GFNPRARVGRDGWREKPTMAVVWFQSTRPRGARRCVRAGGRRRACVSIHAPAWGATKPRWITGPSEPSFNPRARVGRDGWWGSEEAYWMLVSIHAPAWGATRCWVKSSTKLPVF